MDKKEKKRTKLIQKIEQLKIEEKIAWHSYGSIEKYRNKIEQLEIEVQTLQ